MKCNRWQKGAILRTKKSIERKDGHVIPAGSIVRVEDACNGYHVRRITAPRRSAHIFQASLLEEVPQKVWNDIFGRCQSDFREYRDIIEVNLEE